MKLYELTISEARKGLQEKKFSSSELTSACLERIKNVLPVQQRLLWPGAKHTYLPRLLRASRGTASTKCEGHRGLYYDRSRPQLRNSPVLALR